MAAVRTVRIVAEVACTLTDAATEGEMLDAVREAIHGIEPELRHANGRYETQIVAMHTTLLGAPGGSL